MSIPATYETRRVAGEPPRDLGAPVARNAGNRNAPTPFRTHLTLSFRFRLRGFPWCLRAGAEDLCGLEALFDRYEPFFERIKLRSELACRLQAPPGEGIAGLLSEPCDLGAGLLRAARQLVSRVLAALGDLADNLTRSLAGLARCRSGCRKGAFDRCAKGFSDAAVVASPGPCLAPRMPWRQLTVLTRLNGGPMRTYLDPTAPIAPDALLVDDPKTAMDLAVAITESPRMSNLAHGLWGYHGTTAGRGRVDDSVAWHRRTQRGGRDGRFGRFGRLKGDSNRIVHCARWRFGASDASLVATAFRAWRRCLGCPLGREFLQPDAGLTEALIARGQRPGDLHRSLGRRPRWPGTDAIGGAAALDLSSAAFAAGRGEGWNRAAHAPWWSPGNWAAQRWSARRWRKL